MDPTAGLHNCTKCAAEIWAESPLFPLCERCGAVASEPAAEKEPDATPESVAANKTSVAKPAGQRVRSKK